jgi:hypothetical protein
MAAMTTNWATITDGTTTIDFLGNPDFKPFIHNVGAAYYPLGYGKTVGTTDVARRGITLTMVALDSTSHKPTIAADAALQTMLMENVPLTITFPDGATTITVIVDPATDPISTAQYSYWNWAYYNTWTVKLFEADEA